MADVPPPPVPTQLIVFADDWGRHPSSSQHLIRELLPQYPTLWVNTVGTRRPRLNLSDIDRGIGILIRWAFTKRQKEDAVPANGLRVVSPLMYPGYRRPWQRRLNVRQVIKAVESQLLSGHRHVVITTLPTTADLINHLRADRWVYYCVDDYAQWPGTDHPVMAQMENALVALVDDTAAVSRVLAEALEARGKSATLIEHGVDFDSWRTPATNSLLSDRWPTDEKPIALFWGLLDARLETQWLWQLTVADTCRVVLAGPHELHGGAGIAGPRCVMLGNIPFSDLPAHAAAASVLIMPYIDAPVTRAMQPLKLKEYLATMKPVVVRDLPSTREWADCCDLADNADDFVRLVIERARSGTPADQLEARRRRLPGESWTAKAVQLAAIING